jgi:hypothetical protein
MTTLSAASIETVWSMLRDSATEKGFKIGFEISSERKGRALTRTINIVTRPPPYTPEKGPTLPSTPSAPLESLQETRRANPLLTLALARPHDIWR